MKVLFVGDAVVSTGFSHCTHAVCDALHASGHTVTVLGLNHVGDPHPYPYPIYPCRSIIEHAGDPFGIARLPNLIERVNPDIVVILNDCWNIRPYLDRVRHFLPDRSVPIVGWVAVDGMNQKHAPNLNSLLHVAVWTEFAKRELVSSGCTTPITVVPLGVDHSVFAPRDRAESRARVLPAEFADSFIVGAVGRNQLRKRLDLTIECFAEWVHTRQVDNAVLYLHCAPTGEDAADIDSLTAFYNLRKRVIVARALTPGAGAPVDYMASVYSALDVYLSTSQGEGWGLPALEAMACGTPCILPDFAAFGPHGWVGDAAVRVHCSTRLLTAPFGSSLYTIGMVPDKDEIVDALHAMYTSDVHRRTITRRGLTLSHRYSWSSTGEQFVSLLERLHAGVQSAADRESTTTDEPVSDAVQQC